MMPSLVKSLFWREGVKNNAERWGMWQLIEVKWPSWGSAASSIKWRKKNYNSENGCEGYVLLQLVELESLHIVPGA